MFVAGFIGEPPMNFVRTEVKSGKANILGKTIDLDKIVDIKPYEGKPVALGFRPEGILLGEHPDSYVFEMDVDLTELLGDNTNIYVSLGENNLILKVDPHDTPELDTKITFSVPYSNAYLFDGDSENVIARR